ncbi:MAG: DUF2079 domain-containing protein [Anaerolineae bacterium]
MAKASGKWTALRQIEDAGGYMIALAYFLCLAGLSIRLHNTFRTHALDLGYFDQIVWNTSQGRFFVNSLKHPYHFLGDHFSPILALIAPLYWVWSDVRALLVAQTLALALAGLPIYWLAREVDKGLAPWALMAFYLDPDLHLVNLSDFHEIGLVTPFIALALYALVKARYRLLTFSLFMALWCKEDVAIAVMAFGVYLILAGKGRRWGLAILALGALWLAGAVSVAIPYFAQGRYASIGSRYSYLGATLQEALATVLKRPTVLVGHLLDAEKPLAFLRVLLPTAFLPFIGWQVFCLSLPLFAYLQLSDKPSLYTLQEWHVAPILPILFAAAVLALRRLKGYPLLWGLNLRHIAVGALLVASLVAFGLYSPVISALGAEGMSPDRLEHIWAVLERIPPQASVSAQTDLLPHLSHRQEIYLFPSVIDGAEFIVLDTEGNTYPVAEDYEDIVRREVLPHPSFRVLYDSHGFLLLREHNPPLVSPPLEVFGGEIALRGVGLALMDGEGFFVKRAMEGGPLPLVAGDIVQIDLYWEPLSEVEVDYTVFVHFVEGRERHIIGQHDGMPAGAALPTTSWRRGDVVKDTHYVQVAPDGGEGPGQILVGLYELRTGDRLPTKGGESHYVVADFAMKGELHYQTPDFPSEGR